jgi:hypothetical protein
MLPIEILPEISAWYVPPHVCFVSVFIVNPMTAPGTGQRIKKRLYDTTCSSAIAGTEIE